MSDGRIHGVERPASVTFTFDGRVVQGVPGETVAAALWAEAQRTVRRSSVHGTPRALFCNMGICYECLVRVGGVPVRSCLLMVEEGLIVETGGAPEEAQP